ncbi:MAG: Snf7 family protein [Candidatus Thorarchaeota archaeon]
MGFLSGKKEVDAERGILEIKGTMNAITLRIRKLETRISEEHRAAKKAVKQGNKSVARTHLGVAVDLEKRLGRYQQQFQTLQSALMSIEESSDQTRILKTLRTANRALNQARDMLSPAEIQEEMDKLSDSLERVSISSELLSEDLVGSGTTIAEEEQIEKRLSNIEAEVLMEKKTAVPSVEKQQAAVKQRNEAASNRVEELLLELEEEARTERERSS